MLTTDIDLDTVKSESSNGSGKCPFFRRQKTAKFVTTINIAIFTSTQELPLCFFKLPQLFTLAKEVKIKTQIL